MTNPAWKDFENLVAHIQEKLMPGAKVYPNYHVIDKSGSDRQLDVAIIVAAGPYQLLVVVEAKRNTRPVGVEKVEAFVTKLQDVGAHKGIMVSNKGFQKGARASARRHGITLLTYHEAVTTPWDQFLKIGLYGHAVYREIENPTCLALLKINSETVRVPLPITTRLIDQEGKYSTIEREFWHAWIMVATDTPHLGTSSIEFVRSDDTPPDNQLFIDYQNQLIPFVGAAITGYLKLQMCRHPVEIQHEAGLVDEQGNPFYHRAKIWADPDQIRAAGNCRDLTLGEWAELKRLGFGSYGYEYPTEYLMEYYAGASPDQPPVTPQPTKGGGVVISGRFYTPPKRAPGGNRKSRRRNS